MCKYGADGVYLRYGQWEAVVLPDFGMNMISLRYNGKAVLREPGNRSVLENDPYTYGIPLLFPANRTENGRFSFGGVEYELELNEPQRGNHIHGSMFDAPFSPEEIGENSVTAVFLNRGERYPFPFSMTVKDELSNSGLIRTLTLKNTGDTAMPYTLAFHTAFSEPSRFSAPIGERFLCNEFYIPTGKKIPLTETETQYIGGISPAGLVISGFYTAAGHTAGIDSFHFSVSENFDEWILFNGGGRSFLCIEPQCGEVNGLNRPFGHRVLTPGKEAVFILRIGLEDER